MARVLTIEDAVSFRQAVVEAAALLRAGEVVVVPTETVYGLAANALDQTAVRKIFEIKGRPSTNPIIVHVASIKWAERCVTEFNSRAAPLAKAFWPGPLTMVLPRSNLIPDIVTAGGSTVAIRWPSHPFMRALIQECDFPLAAPSANLSTEVSATIASHAEKSLGARVKLIVDAGPAAVGIESTVVNLTTQPAQILRPGMISREQIALVLGEPVGRLVKQATVENASPSPGLMPKHYAPAARVLIATWKSADDFADIFKALRLPLHAHARVVAHSVIPREGPQHTVALMPFDPEAYARALFAEFHRADEMGVKVILIESLPATPEWEGINDRLSRAAYCGD
jgi:L-threonylcarbamoyladenylate synthase